MLSFQGWIKEKAVRRRILMNAFSLHAKSTCLNSIEKNLSPETWKFVLRRHRPDGLKEEEEAACNDFNFFIDQSHTALFAVILGKVLQQHAILEEDCSKAILIWYNSKGKKEKKKEAAAVDYQFSRRMWFDLETQNKRIIFVGLWSQRVMLWSRLEIDENLSSLEERGMSTVLIIL